MPSMPTPPPLMMAISRGPPPVRRRCRKKRRTTSRCRRRRREENTTTVADATAGLADPKKAISILKDLYDNWARRHERDQVIEEGSLLVNVVKAFRLFHRQVQAFLSDDPEPRILEPSIDFAGEIATGGVRFDDRKRPFECHRISNLFDCPTRYFAFWRRAQGLGNAPASGGGL